jgi:hypothetical protein
MIFMWKIYTITNLCVLLMMKMFRRKDVCIFDTRKLVGSYSDNLSMFFYLYLNFTNLSLCFFSWNLKHNKTSFPYLIAKSSMHNYSSFYKCAWLSCLVAKSNKHNSIPHIQFCVTYMRTQMSIKWVSINKCVWGILYWYFFMINVHKW